MNGSGYVGYISAEQPRYYSRTVAQIFGVSAAIFLQELAFSLNPDYNKNLYDEKHWFYNTYEQWAERLGCSAKTVQRTVADLVQRKILLVVKNPRVGWDRKNWYTIDYQELDRQIDAFLKAKVVAKPQGIPSGQYDQMQQDGTTSSSRTTRLDASGQNDLNNSNNTLEIKLTTTTTNTVVDEQSLSGHENDLERKISCATRQFPVMVNDECLPTLGQEDAAEVESVTEMVTRCGLTKSAAANLVAEFGTSVCRKAYAAMAKNQINGRKVTHSIYKYFRSIAKVKTLEAPSQLEEEIHAAECESAATEERKKIIAALKLDVRQGDSAQAYQALTTLKQIVDGAVGWSADDQAMAADALACGTFQEQQARGQDYIRQIKLSLAGGMN